MCALEESWREKSARTSYDGGLDSGYSEDATLGVDAAEPLSQHELSRLAPLASVRLAYHRDESVDNCWAKPVTVQS